MISTYSNNSMQQQQPELHRSLPGHNDPVASLCFSSSSKQLASASSDHLLYLWNLQGRNAQALKLKGHSAAITEVAFSPSGALLATASMDHTVRVWTNSAADGYPSTAIRSHGACVKSVAFSPDSRLLVSGSDDKTVKLFNVRSGEQASTRKFVRSLLGHSNWVTSARFSVDGKAVASGGSDRSVLLWDLETGSSTVQLRDHEGRVNAVRFLPESNCSPR